MINNTGCKTNSKPLQLPVMRVSRKFPFLMTGFILMRSLFNF